MVTRYTRQQFNSAIPVRPQAAVDDDPELLNNIKSKGRGGNTGRAAEASRPLR